MALVGNKKAIFTGGGRDKSMFTEDFDNSTVEGVMLNFRKEIIADLKKSLAERPRKYDTATTGNLAASIDGHVIPSKNRLTLQIEFGDKGEYWAYVDKGVDGWQNSHGSMFKFKRNGKRIPLEAMRSVIRLAGLVPKKVQLKSGKTNRKLSKATLEDARNQMAWAMGNVIKKEGIKPTHFFTNVINDELKERLTKAISIALKKDIELTFTTRI